VLTHQPTADEFWRHHGHRPSASAALSRLVAAADHGAGDGSGGGERITGSSGRVTNWRSSVPRVGTEERQFADEDDVALAAITVAELLVGVELTEGKKRVQRQTFVDDSVATIPVLTYDLDVAAAHAELLVAVRRQGLPRGAHDLIIAATAKAANRLVVTADATAFENLPEVAVRAHVS
jgi:tRNA(fMet)-specific endonuclease VapC